MLPAGIALGPYQILALLGKGGMGEVYRARDSRLSRDVAVKVIAPDLARNRDRIRRFEQEARAAGVLAHPNVCAVFDIGIHDDSPFVVMELLEGESLRSHLLRGPVSARKAVDYIMQTAHGLASAHEKGIVHRDLKPENLFLTKDGRIKVLDFGLAKLTQPELLTPEGEEAITVAATETGATLGTMGYMAPEQVRGEPADHRTDLFALGAVLYELLAGKRAFAGATIYETSHRILNEDPLPLSASGREIPMGIEAIMRRCLEKSPGDRFQSAKDLAFALGAVTSDALSSRDLPDRRGGRAAFLSRNGFLAIATLAVVVATAAGTAVAVRRIARSSPVQPATYARLNIAKGNVVCARFSEGTSSVIYSGALGGRPAQILEIRPQSPISRAFGPPDADLLSVSANGTMAITFGAPNHSGWPRKGTLAELPITGGAPRILLESVFAADWLPGGTQLAVVHHADGEYRIEMPPGRVLYRTVNRVMQLRVAPSGQWLAFGEGGAGRASVVIVDAKGKIAARSEVWQRVRGLAWSADGRDVWYSSSRNMWACEIRAMTTGGEERVVSSIPGLLMLHDIGRDGRVLLAREDVHTGIRGYRASQDGEQELGWLDWSWASDISADGRTVVFTEQQASSAIFVRSMDGAPATKLGDGSEPTLSPDGQWVLAIDQGPPPQLRLLPTGAGESLALPSGAISGYAEPRWHPDGAHVFFVGVDAHGSRRTYAQDLVGGSPRPITPDGHTGSLVSPDGRRIVVTSEDTRVHAVTVDGGAEETIELEPGDQLIQWTSDGRGVFALEPGGANRRIVRIDWNTGQRRHWRSLSAPDSTSSVIYNVLMTPDGENYAYTYIHRLNELYVAEGLN